jgi:osmotically-inducible protein OsmY
MSDLRPDEEVQKDVLGELKWDPRVSPNEIGVIVRSGVVTLTGHVDSFYKKWAAQQAAHRVRGVKAVANDLEIKLPSTSVRTDEELAAAAVQAIESDALLGGENLQITVSNGRITVSGEVDWNYQREDVERLLRRLWGVKGVTNLITVKAGELGEKDKELKAKEIKETIEQALIRSAEVDAKSIDVEVEGTKAILKGNVRSWAEREQAERTAWLAPGITQVEDKIQVSHV